MTEQQQPQGQQISETDIAVDKNAIVFRNATVPDGDGSREVVYVLAPWPETTTAPRTLVDEAKPPFMVFSDDKLFASINCENGRATYAVSGNESPEINLLLTLQAGSEFSEPPPAADEARRQDAGDDSQ